MKFEGIYTPAITPHAPDGAIDREAFAEVLESLIAAGVHGIIVGGSTGEYYAHSPQERFDLAAQAREVIGGRVPLIVGTGAIRTEDSVAYAKAAKEIKADAILVTSPPYAIPTERENAVHALTIDRAADLPIMLYNYPGRMGVSHGRGVFLPRRPVEECGRDQGKLGRHGPGAHAGAEVPEHRAQLRLGRPGARVLRLGGAELGLRRIELHPEGAYRALRGLRRREELRQGPAIMTAMLPLMSFLDGGKFVQSIKHGCELAGLKAGTLRAPLRPLNEEDRRGLETVVATLKRTVAQITSGANHA